MKVVSLTLFCALLLIADSPSLSAQTPDRVPNMAVTNGSRYVHPLKSGNDGLAQIYSNLGPSGDTYDDNLGWIVFGPDTGLMQWMAMPFTPRADATVRRIKVAIGNEGGTNSVRLLLTADAGGKPGKTLRRWEVKNLFMQGGCCSLDIAYSAGIKVTKGTLYWIVAITDRTNPDAQDVWQYSFDHTMGNIAYNLGAGWKPYPNQVVAAFSVLGTKP
jgi:hypothetical protein